MIRTSNEDQQIRYVTVTDDIVSYWTHEQNTDFTDFTGT